jgi:outer membrane protein assembly factor BamB
LDFDSAKPYKQIAQKNSKRSEKMGNHPKKIVKTFTVLITVLLLSSAIALIVNLETPTASAATNTSDLLQYEWTQLGATGGWNLYSAGPAPNTPEVAWTRSFTGSGSMFAGTVTAFNGLVFATTTNTIYAFDAFTGASVWNFTRTNGNFQSSPTKIDDTYMFLDGDTGQGGLGIGTTPGLLTNATVTVLRISDGTFVSNFTVVGVGFQPGAGGYFPGRYDTQTHMKYVRGYDAQTNICSYYAIDLSNPTAPKLGWHTVLDESGEDLSVGAGVLLVGTVNGAVLGLNDTTGDVIWRAQKVGFAQYTATYVDGMFIQGSASTTLTAYNATTGDIIWDKEQGGRAFFAFAGAVGYGRFYQHNIAVPQGFVGCWDVQTGELLWKMPALYQIGYITPALADGKLYIQRYSGTAAGVTAETNTFSCFDAFTGDLIWELSGVSIVNPSIAYGNLYALIGNTIYCFSDSTPADWSMWRGNTDQPGISQTSGPLTISPEWAFKTAGPITSSAAIVDGKAYFGSQDNNIYCIDATTGTQIWNYTTQYRVFSSPAVVDGKVFTGADDGTIHALNANTGEVLWTTPAGGLTNYVFAGTWQPRSSPIVVDNKLYVGALDGKLYCLDTSNGQVQWTKQLGNATYPIAGSPAYSDGYIYIDCTNHNLYKINANTGDIVWTTTSTASIARAYTNFFPWSTPVVFNNTVYWGAGPVYGTLVWYALNATDGRQIWNVTNSAAQTPDTNFRFLGNTPTCQTPVVLQWNSSISVMIVAENLGVSIRNANTGERIYFQFLGHEVYSSVAYANEPGQPKFYIGSDTYAITCFDMAAAMRNDTANAVLSVFTTNSHVQASPSLWNGKLYVGSADGSFYMFSDRVQQGITLYAVMNKGEEMWNNETITITGKLYPNRDDSGYGSSDLNGLPNATLTITFTKPDMSSTNVTTTTDGLGNFAVSFDPTEVGTWSWVAIYDGQVKPAITYNSAYSEWASVNVIPAPSSEATSTPEPTLDTTPTATPTETITPEVTLTATPEANGEPIAVEYIYAAIAIIIIVVVVIGAFLYIKRKK